MCECLPVEEEDDVELRRFLLDERDDLELATDSSSLAEPYIQSGYLDSTRRILLLPELEVIHDNIESDPERTV